MNITVVILLRGAIFSYPISRAIPCCMTKRSYIMCAATRATCLDTARATYWLVPITTWVLIKDHDGKHMHYVAAVGGYASERPLRFKSSRSDGCTSMIGTPLGRADGHLPCLEWVPGHSHQWTGHLVHPSREAPPPPWRGYRSSDARTFIRSDCWCRSYRRGG